VCCTIANPSCKAITKPSEDECARAVDVRKDGNRALKDGDVEGALSLYSKAAQINPGSEVTFTCKATALIKLERFEEAVLDCSSALELNPDYIKAMHRRGVALAALKRWEEAEGDLLKVVACDTENEKVLAELQAVQEQMAKEKAAGVSRTKGGVLNGGEGLSSGLSGMSKVDQAAFGKAAAAYDAEVEARGDGTGSRIQVIDEDDSSDEEEMVPVKPFSSGNAIAADDDDGLVGLE
jgi:tetratricopeptide (TPR) repeat protein